MSSLKKYHVALEAHERTRLLELTRRGKAAARMITRARILLLCHEGYTDDHILKVLQVGTATVARVRKRFIDEGLDAALSEKPRPGARPKMTATQHEALRVLMATPPPGGQKQWSLRQLADHLVRLQFVDHISHETIRTSLKKVQVQHVDIASAG